LLANPFPQVIKNRDQKRVDRLAQRQDWADIGARGETRGWQIKSSAGMPVMQFIQGGRFQPINA
jgi:hypothetical protein